MAKIIHDLKEKIKSKDEQLGTWTREYCVGEEFDTIKSLYDENKQLPKGVSHDVIIEQDGKRVDRFYRFVTVELSDDEWKEYIALKQYMDIHTIKNCVVFFTVIAVISLVLGIIIGISLA